MPFICLQAGHEGRESGATGAPGEQELTKRIRDELRWYLQERGFVVQLVNADPADSEIKKDFDLFLSLHGDADIYGTGGGCIGSGDKSVDSSWQRSAEIRDAIASEYFKESGIENRPERVNANMTKYYMWSRLTAKTPCVLLEMGVVQNAHDKVILADTSRICKAITRGICKAFNVPYDLPSPEPTPEPTPTPTPNPEPEKPPMMEVTACDARVKKALDDMAKEHLKEIEDFRGVIKDAADDLFKSFASVNEYAVEKGVGQLEITDLNGMVNKFKNVIDQLIEAKSQVVAGPTQSIWEKLTSRKFQAYVVTIATPLLSAINGVLDWRSAVTAIVIASLGYMGINVADSFAHAREVEANTAARTVGK